MTAAVQPSQGVHPIRRPEHSESYRVLIGADTYPPDVNGAAYFARRLALGLAGRGHDVHVVCPSDTGPARTDREDGVTVHRLRSVGVPVHPTFRLCLPSYVGSAAQRVVAQVAPDVVHIQAHFLVGRGLARAATRQQVPLLATNHFMPDNLLPYLPVPAFAAAAISSLGWRDFARVVNRAAVVTTPTPTAADLIGNKGLRPPVEAISCGIDLDRFRPDSPGATTRRFALGDRPTILFVGRLDAEKHLGEIIAALPAVRRHVDAQVVFVGTGSHAESLKRQARQCGVANDVHFLGFVPDEELPAVYGAADVFCMPGVAELQSLATLEAMSSGLPVVAADAMALPHLVHPGQNGFLFQPGDTDALAGHLVAVLANPSLRKRMGQASVEIAASHDQTATLAAFETLYARLIGRQLSRDVMALAR